MWLKEGEWVAGTGCCSLRPSQLYYPQWRPEQLGGGCVRGGRGETILDWGQGLGGQILAVQACGEQKLCN